jgi:hypothetical protein
MSQKSSLTQPAQAVSGALTADRFKPGDLIALTPDHMRALFLALLTYRNELFKEQIAPHVIDI